MNIRCTWNNFFFFGCFYVYPLRKYVWVLLTGFSSITRLVQHPTIDDLTWHRNENRLDASIIHDNKHATWLLPLFCQNWYYLFSGGHVPDRNENNFPVRRTFFRLAVGNIDNLCKMSSRQIVLKILIAHHHLTEWLWHLVCFEEALNYQVSISMCTAYLHACKLMHVPIECINKFLRNINDATHFWHIRPRHLMHVHKLVSLEKLQRTRLSQRQLTNYQEWQVSNNIRWQHIFFEGRRKINVKTVLGHPFKNIKTIRKKEILKRILFALSMTIEAHLSIPFSMSMLFVVGKKKL